MRCSAPELASLCERMEVGLAGTVGAQALMLSPGLDVATEVCTIRCIKVYRVGAEDFTVGTRARAEVKSAVAGNEGAAE